MLRLGKAIKLSSQSSIIRSRVSREAALQLLGRIERLSKVYYDI